MNSAEPGPNPPPNYGAARYLPMRDSIIFAGFEGEQPLWPQPSRLGDPMARGMAAAAHIDARNLKRTGH